MKIYISGKVTGTDDYKERFEAAADHIRNIGFTPVNPVALDAILPKDETTWEQYMQADMGLLRACEAIYLIPGWEDSTGARIEKMEAERLRKPIFKSFAEIEEARKEAK